MQYLVLNYGDICGIYLLKENVLDEINERKPSFPIRQKIEISEKVHRMYFTW